MNKVFTLLILFCHFGLIGQEHFILHVEPERKNSINLYKKTNLKSTTWIINGKVIKYKKGTYCIPINNNGTFDTIQQKTIRESTHFQFNQKRFKYKSIVHIDTISKLTVAKFKKDNHYKLTQTSSGNFAFFTADTIDTNHQIIVNIKNFNRLDNWYIHFNEEKTIQIDKDTTITLNFNIQSIRTEPLVNLFIDNQEKLVSGISISRKYESIFDLNYLILNNEKTSITIDLLTNKIQLE